MQQCKFSGGNIDRYIGRHLYGYTGRSCNQRINRCHHAVEQHGRHLYRYLHPWLVISHCIGNHNNCSVGNNFLWQQFLLQIGKHGTTCNVDGYIRWQLHGIAGRLKHQRINRRRYAVHKYGRRLHGHLYNRRIGWLCSLHNDNQRSDNYCTVCNHFVCRPVL